MSRLASFLPARAGLFLCAFSVSAAATAAAPAHWSYSAGTGPGHWGALAPSNASCATGRAQSPIDIRPARQVRGRHVEAFDYQAGAFELVNNGHTVQANPVPGAEASAIRIDGQRYELAQFHFHHPSEHKDEAGHLAVLGVLIREGAASEALREAFEHLPVAAATAEGGTDGHGDHGDHADSGGNGGTTGAEPPRFQIALDKLLPARRASWLWEGSLTTPPCSEGVRWVVLKQPITLSKVQIAAFAKLFPDNHRPLQAIDGRRLEQAQPQP